MKKNESQKNGLKQNIPQFLERKRKKKFFLSQGKVFADASRVQVKKSEDEK